jgi:hypothetical protein
VRLQVGVIGAEELLRARVADLLGAVDDLAAAVVALAGIALGVLVGQRRAELVRFSLAMSCNPPRRRSSSSSTTPAISGSWCCSASKSGPQKGVLCSAVTFANGTRHDLHLRPRAG